MTRARVSKGWIVAALCLTGCGGVVHDEPPGGAAASGTSTCQVGADDDPKNCGYCGHDCGDAACSSGRCAVEVLAVDPHVPASLAVDANRVYWIDTSSEGGVHAIPLVGGDDVLVAASSASWGYGHRILVNATDLVWLSPPNQPMRLPLAGGEPVVLSTAAGGPVGIGLDPASLYYSAGDGDGFSLVKVPLGDPAPVVLAPVPALDIAVGEADAYWTRCDQGRVERVPLVGGPVTLVTDAGCPLRIQLAGDFLYFVDTPDGAPNLAIQRVAVTGGEVTTVVAVGENQTASLAFAVDDDAVYYGVDHELMRAPLDGGPAVALATVATLSDVVSYGDHVYWTDAGGDGGNPPGQVARITK